MKTVSVVSLVGAMAASALLLGACKAEEQGRITKYKPGTYLGKVDTKLSDDQVRIARNRTAMQAGDTVVPGGRAAPSSRPADVRPPE